MECFRLLLEYLAWIEHQFLSGIRDSRKAGSLRGMMRGVGEVRMSEHQSWLAKGLGLGYYVEVLREFKKRFRRKRPVFFKPVSGISSRTKHQFTTPFMSQTIWPKWASRQFVTLPRDQTLLPVTFGYFLSSIKNLKDVVWDNWGDERGCDEGDWHTHTRGLHWGLPEVVGTVEQVHCSRGRLLRMGLDFHVCTINKSAHTKRLETYLMILIPYEHPYLWVNIRADWSLQHWYCYKSRSWKY